MLACSGALVLGEGNGGQRRAWEGLGGRGRARGDLVDRRQVAVVLPLARRAVAEEALGDDNGRVGEGDGDGDDLARVGGRLRLRLGVGVAVARAVGE